MLGPYDRVEVMLYRWFVASVSVGLQSWYHLDCCVSVEVRPMLGPHVRVQVIHTWIVAHVKVDISCQSWSWTDVETACQSRGYTLFNNTFATNAVKAAQINFWWYHYVTKVNPAMRNTDPPCAYISVVFVPSYLWWFSSLTSYLALGKIASQFSAMVYKCKEKVDCMYGFWTTGMARGKQHIAPLLNRDRLICPEWNRSICI